MSVSAVFTSLRPFPVTRNTIEASFGSSSCTFKKDMGDYKAIGYPYIPPEGTSTEDVKATRDWPICEGSMP